jgi:hypothetical protein
MSVESVLAFLGFVAKHSPAVAEWISNLAAGDESARDTLRAAMSPVHEGIEAFLESKRRQ